MVALPKYNGVVQDDAGNLVPNVSIEVRSEDSGALVQVYANRDGTGALGSPFTSSTGRVEFHVAAGEYKITATKGSDTWTLRYVQIGPASIENAMGAETEITGSSYDVEATETFLTIKRTGPTLTTINLPPVADRGGLPFAYVDWSTGIVSDHEIKFVPDGTETVMKAANFSAWSNSSGLARGWVYPAEDLSGWVVT